jgi:CxxC motif-containing protein (DUF1111 family)
MEVEMKQRNALSMTWCVGLAALLSVGPLRAQKDPGPRGGPAAAGGSYQNLTDAEKSFFGTATMRFMEVDSVSGTIEDGSGLGPTFNGNSCAGCHSQPAIGGASPGLKSPQNPVPNPQVALATLDGATNTVPSFITNDGPVREARFIRNHDGSLDGGVHGLYTIAGRTDAPGCTLAQPDFAGQVAAHNVVLRTPPALFGLGLVDNTADATLQANLSANQSLKRSLGIGGRFNTSGNDGTIMRFGWKGQDKSLVMFSGEAYNVEQGVSNELFANERSAVPGCVFNGSPEDATIIDGTPEGNDSGDLINFAVFMRFLAPPQPAASTPSTDNGAALFNSVGCALCHTPTLTTTSSQYVPLNNVAYHPYSDFALHHMGSTLADGVNQGAAGPDEFRTAPLWGIGQRLYFLHDGRTADLLQAIEAHASPGGCGGNLRWASRNQNCGSEANAVIHRFNALSATQKQDILNFLRSL